MNTQIEQGETPQYIISLENILGSIEQVNHLLRRLCRERRPRRRQPGLH